MALKHQCPLHPSLECWSMATGSPGIAASVVSAACEHHPPQCEHDLVQRHFRSGLPPPKHQCNPPLYNRKSKSEGVVHGERSAPQGARLEWPCVV